MKILQVVVGPVRLAGLLGDLAAEVAPPPAHHLRHVAEEGAAPGEEFWQRAVLVLRHGVMAALGIGEVAREQRRNVAEQPPHGGTGRLGGVTLRFGSG